VRTALDPSLSKEELLGHIRAGAKDLSEREQFTPLRILRGNRRMLLLFTQQTSVQEFAHDYVRQVKRIMPFEVLGVKGQIAVRMFDDVHAVVFNASTKHEYELPPGVINLLRRLYSPRRLHIPDNNNRRNLHLPSHPLFDVVSFSCNINCDAP
jgi:hypothetical protein